MAVSIGHSCVWVEADPCAELCQLTDERCHLCDVREAVKAYGEEVGGLKTEVGFQ